ncbi:hypothetical protein [Kitasatospora griseola]|uniref:hypothetical protein n=1 Tax=Kitasatospora griseola TaxID=2064 RepID=UPI00166FAE64|nr:hypothetical protein [Kitasatospora griseola]GGQ94778.1 hypothetical protein GCM10010195_58340 [Kitasatospora griseola]
MLYAIKRRAALTAGALALAATGLVAGAGPAAAEYDNPPSEYTGSAMYAENMSLDNCYAIGEHLLVTGQYADFYCEGYQVWWWTSYRLWVYW